MACGAPRWPLASVPVNVAGRPAKVGGSIAWVLGWVVLAFGLAAALVAGAILQAIFPAGVAGWIVGGVIGVFALTIGLALLISGRKLRDVGVGREREVAVEAIYALAARQGGVVTPEDVGRALRLPVPRADELLTDLAKRGERVRLEVDDSGQLLYFVDRPASRMRVAAPRGGARFDAEPPPSAELTEEEERPEELRRHRSR